MSRTRIPEDTQFVPLRLNSDGYGVAGYQANDAAKLRQVLIKGALPGERVGAKVVKRRRGQFWAEVQSLEQPHRHRVNPPCAHFPRCGGCVLQHLDYAQQLQHKEQYLLEQLAQQQVVYQRLREATSGPRLHYRSKARLGVRQLTDDLLLGFRESFSSRVLRMDGCLTLVPELAQAMPALRETLAGLSVCASIPQIEVAAGDSSRQVVVRHLQPLIASDLAALARFGEDTHIQVLLQSAGPDSVRDLSGWQAPLLSYGVPEFGLDLHFGALDFTQVNMVLNRTLIQRVVAAVQAAPGDRVVDLFCGLGNFSLPLARAGAQVLGVEGAIAAVLRARSNAARNGLVARTEFQVGDLYQPDAQTLFNQLPSARALLLDPPRSGVGPHLGAWLAAPGLAQLDTVAYVSCNPVSFAQDAQVLVQAGFVLAEVGIFDMFPQTSHVETLGVFRRG